MVPDVFSWSAIRDFCIQLVKVEGFGSEFVILGNVELIGYPLPVP